MTHLHDWLKSLGPNNRARAQRLSALTGTPVSQDAIKDLLANSRKSIPYRYRLIAHPLALAALLQDIVGYQDELNQDARPRG